MVDVCAVVEMVLEQYSARKKHRRKEEDVPTELLPMQTGEKTVVILTDRGASRTHREWSMASEIPFPLILVSQHSHMKEVVQIGMVNCCCNRCSQHN